MGKKKDRAAQAAAVDEEPAAPTSTKRERAEDGAEPNKRLQRETRELVSKMRREGKAEEEINTAKKKLKKSIMASAPDEGEAAPQVQEQAEAEAPPPKKKRKQTNESGQEVATAASDGLEDQRKRLQRETRELVLSMRREGHSEDMINRAKKKLKKTIMGDQRSEAAVSKREEKSKDYWGDYWGDWDNDEYQAARKERAQTVHDVVVIPVIWRGRHDHQEISGAAEDIKGCLAQQGVDCWIDSRRHYTPGQKFAHWEHRGVLIRIEVGPQDFQAGICQVCKAETPGDYQSVRKKKVRLPPSGTRALLLALKEFGLDKIEIERREGDSADEGEEAVGRQPAKQKQEAKEEDDVLGNWAPHANTFKEKKGKKKKAG